MDGNITITGQGPNVGGAGSVTDFATQVAEKKQRIDEIQEQLTGPDAQNLTPQQLDDLTNQLNVLQQQIENLQSECPEDDTTDQTKLSDMNAQIWQLTANIGALESGESTISSSGAGKDPSSVFPGSNDPQLYQGSTNNVSLDDQANLWLATGLMAIIFKVEVALIHQQIQNMDQERICKIHGYQNIMEFGNAAAAATFKSDMDQAKMYMVQYYTAIAQAAVTGFTALGGLGRQGRIERENEQMRNNTSYTKQLETMRKVNTSDPKQFSKLSKEHQQLINDHGKDYFKRPLPKLYENGREVKPGRKQLQEEMEYSKTYGYEPIASTTPGGTTISAQNPTHPDRVKDQQRIKSDMDSNGREIQAGHYRLSNDMMLHMWRNMLPQLGQSIIQAYQAHENYEISIDKANQDYQKIIWQTALQNAQSYLDNASQCFQSELQNAEQVIEFLIDAAQKGTQWSSVRG